MDGRDARRWTDDRNVPADFVFCFNDEKETIFFALDRIYKDRGGPAQLGTRDWAGLKGHIDDRNLACSLASEGRSEAPRPGGG